VEALGCLSIPLMEDPTIEVEEERDDNFMDGFILLLFLIIHSTLR